MKEMIKEDGNDLGGFIDKNSRVYETEDLKHELDNPFSNLGNPSPLTECTCCGKHLSELKPFGKAGDPLIRDCNGELLVRTYRTFRHYHEEVEKALDEAKKNGIDTYQGIEEWLIDKYGKEKGENLIFLFYEATVTDKFFLCRDCIVLDEKEFFEVIDKKLS